MATANPYLTPYGYAQAPGQGGLGYYEQQTPMGSFAAANYTGMPAQQFATSGQAGVQQIQGVGPVSQGIGANSYLGQTTPGATAATNSMAGVANPYLNQAISAAQGDATRAFQETVNPQMAAMEAASGSFGNTGVQAARERSYRDLGNTLGNIATNARMGDYNQQLQLAENAANRQTGVSQYNSGLAAGDLNRNLSGTFQGQGLQQQGRMFDASNALGAQQFNAGAANQIGMFNAGQGNQTSMFNAGQGNTMGQAGAGLNQAVNLYNTGAANTMLGQQRSLNEGARQFDTNFDYTAARNAIYDPMNLQTMNLNNQVVGQNMAYQQQMQPLIQAQQMANIGATVAGTGGSQTQNLQGNPWLSAAGGYLTGSQLYGG